MSKTANKRMEQMNFFDAFGLEDDFFGSATTVEAKPAKAAKKEEKKAPAKKEAGKATTPAAKASKDFDVKLPVCVKARSFKVDAFKIGEAASAKASKVWEELEKAYPQFGIKAFKLAYVRELNAIFVCDGFLASDMGTAVFKDENSVVKVCDGSLTCELTPAEWPEEDPGEVTLGELTERFVAANPSYDGCGLYFDAESDIAYPVFNANVSAKTGDVVTVIVGGEPKEIAVEDGSSIYDERIPGVMVTVKAPKTGADGYVTYSSTSSKSTQVYAKEVGTVKEAAKTAEKKYPLPMTLMVANFNATYQLTPEMFDGKARVTKEEITKGMAKVDALFGDADRKIEYVYSENRNVMSCMFVSGKKGAIA